MRYDNPYWEFDIPVNPPISPGEDVDPLTGDVYSYSGPDRCEVPTILVDGRYIFEPRISK